MGTALNLIKHLIKNTFNPFTYILLIKLIRYRLKYKVNYASEVFYWWYMLSLDYTNGELSKSFDFQNLLLKCIEKYNFKNPQVLDVGSGPRGLLNKGAIEKKYTLINADPLAEFYNLLLDKYFPNTSFRPVKFFGEKLTDSFEESFFDIVVSKNALDHAISPKKCINEMLKVLKGKGLLILVGAIKEGTNQKWRGLHKYDFFIKDKKLLCQNFSGEKTVLINSKDVDYLESSQTGNNPGDSYTIVFQKK